MLVMVWEGWTHARMVCGWVIVVSRVALMIEGELVGGCQSGEPKREARWCVCVVEAYGWGCAAEHGMQQSGGGWFVLGADVFPCFCGAHTRARARICMCIGR